MTRRRRNSLRLQGYDYSQAGLYFVTVVLRERTPMFGEIVNETMLLNDAGKIVQGVWQSLAKQYNVILDEFIIMPDHIHGIIQISNPVRVGLAPLQTSTTHDGKSQTVGVGLALPQKPIVHTGEIKDDSRPTQPASNTSENTIPYHDKIISSTQNEFTTNNTQRVGLEYFANNPRTLPTSNNNKRPTPTVDDQNDGLSDVMRFFKSLSAKRINILHKTSGRTVWQTGFHDRVIRDDEELNAIRDYIQTNPQRWTGKPL
ncbi:MAG: transposase [Trueperaceae bacterium]